jgi:hypothetical protein
MDSYEIETTTGISYSGLASFPVSHSLSFGIPGKLNDVNKCFYPSIQ